MTLPDIKQANLDNKRVLMRVDFNVAFEDGKPKDRHKIGSVKKTIDFIAGCSGVRLALLSHLGRPSGVEGKYSFRNYCKGIGEALGRDLVFVEDCLSDVGIGVSLLENVRFYDEDLENNEDFSKKLAKNYDIFVNEAFGVCHRRHSSVVGITKILPSFAGLNLLKEVEVLGMLRDNFERPAYAIIGGAKAETKIPVINFFAKNYDKVLIGGRIGEEILSRGARISENVILPEDYTGNGLDIGMKSVKLYSGFLKKAKTIVWNGPLGKFEESEFAVGTERILETLIQNTSAYKVAGGGETAQVLEEKGVIQKFDFVSTGGGAMLEFLAKGTLPALEALKI